MKEQLFIKYTCIVIHTLKSHSVHGMLEIMKLQALHYTSFCRYPGTTFMDHILRYHDDPNVKMVVVLGEVRAVDYYNNS